MSASAKEKFIVALDAPDASSTYQLLDRLGDSVSWIKVGLQLFTAEGPSIVRELKARGYRVFLDLKFHDIPNTAKEAVASAAKLGVDMTTIHLGGGAKMIAAAQSAVGDSGMLILGVTVLTSFDQTQLEGVGVNDPVEAQVSRLVRLGYDNGARGIVCSPLELPVLRATYGDELTIVTPGVRPAGGDKGDQQRVMTPAEAIRAGASYLVIGRPITGAADPRAAALAITEEIASA